MAHVTKDRFGDPLWCGRTWVVHESCVWKACFNEHDCGRINSQGKWVRDGQCLTNYRRGCPADEDETILGCCGAPKFVWPFQSKSFKICKSCGRHVPADMAYLLWEQADEERLLQEGGAHGT